VFVLFYYLFLCIARNLKWHIFRENWFEVGLDFINSNLLFQVKVSKNEPITFNCKSILNCNHIFRFVFMAFSDHSGVNASINIAKLCHAIILPGMWVDSLCFCIGIRAICLQTGIFSSLSRHKISCIIGGEGFYFRFLEFFLIRSHFFSMMESDCWIWLNWTGFLCKQWSLEDPIIPVDFPIPMAFSAKVFSPYVGQAFIAVYSELFFNLFFDVSRISGLPRDISSPQ